MGKTYMEMVDSVMDQYRILMNLAYAEYDSTGCISDETDMRMRDLEVSLALLEVAM